MPDLLDVPGHRRHVAPAIERWLRLRIDETLPGDYLPSTTQIAGEFGVSHETAARVYRKLQDEGLVRIVPGAGVIKL